MLENPTHQSKHINDVGRRIAAFLSKHRTNSWTWWVAAHTASAVVVEGCTHFLKWMARCPSTDDNHRRRAHGEGLRHYGHLRCDFLLPHTEVCGGIRPHWNRDSVAFRSLWRGDSDQRPLLPPSISRVERDEKPSEELRLNDRNDTWSGLACRWRRFL